MAYTTPRTWTVGLLATAAMLNTDIRDNFIAHQKRLDACNAYAAPGYHFDGSALEAEWAWAGSPSVTPAVVNFSDSYLRLAFSTGQGQKGASLYQTTALTTERQARVGLASPVVDNSIGIGWYDGDAENNVMFLDLVGAALNTYAIVLTNRVGGGAWNSQALATGLPWGAQYTLHMVPTGTPWSSWSVKCYMSINTYKTSYLGISSDYWAAQTWTPGRRGIQIYNNQTTDADSWREFHVDWYT